MKRDEGIDLLRLAKARRSRAARDNEAADEMAPSHGSKLFARADSRTISAVPAVAVTPPQSNAAT